MPDLASCAREPIHIPGAIQPHGALLALDERGQVIEQASRNAAALLGVDAGSLLGRPLAQVIDAPSLAAVQSALDSPDPASASPLPIRGAGAGARAFDGIVHRSGPVTILELEPAPSTEGVAFGAFYQAVRHSIRQLQAAPTIDEAMRRVVAEIKRLTGFARVMLYRFDPDWNGNVVAELADPGQTRYLGLRFPHSDIPEQARKLYSSNWLRLIVDRDYEPVPLVPPAHPRTGAPLDMSQAVLRSVSPVHLEYLRNMGVRASMSVSVMKDDQLWGLIACHHDAPRPVPYQVRAACEFIGQIFSYQLAAIEGRQDYLDRRALAAQLESLARDVRAAGLPDGLARRAPGFAAVAGATGAALFLGDDLWTDGQVPADAVLRDLATWLLARATSGIFVTDSLARERADLAPLAPIAAGVMALRLAPGREDLLLWLKPEVVGTVEWAGDPRKPVVQVDGSDARLHPRKSFELWKETVRLRSEPWGPLAVDAAEGVRKIVVDQELVRLNKDLAQSNEELDAFTYVASHDLKEPVRGIRNYATFILEDEGPSLDAETASRLAGIVRLTGRMDDLISSLYHYARVGRVKLATATTDLNDVLAGVVDRLTPALDEHGVELRVPRPLPTVVADRVRVGEVFYNLILNAIKYNDKPKRWVEVGWREPGTFYVQDNGIGIEPRHADHVFTIFKRLHGKDKYGGGSGAGLTIAKRIVTMHGGRIWLESTPGVGTTFWFTLEESPRADQT